MYTNMEKSKIGQKTRRKALRDIFYLNASLMDYDWQDIPKEAQDRTDKAFNEFIDSILDIDDTTSELSINCIFDHHIIPLVKYDIIFGNAKCGLRIKSGESSSDNKISRRKIMDDPEIRRKALQSLFHHQVSLYPVYHKNVPEEAKDRINKAFERYIDSLLDAMDTDGAERLSLPIDYIFNHLIVPLVTYLLTIKNG